MSSSYTRLISKRVKKFNVDWLTQDWGSCHKEVGAPANWIKAAYNTVCPDTSGFQPQT